MSEATSDPAAAAGRRATGAPPRVLVVDDDANMRFALTEGLGAYGFDVEAVGDADAACAVDGARRPDIVVLDWVLAGGESGVAACRRVCDAHPGVPVAMLTGRADASDQRAALEAGASAFLVKGIPLETLAERLRGLLASS